MRVLSVLLLTMISFGCGGYGSQTPATPQPGVTPAIAELSPDNVDSGSPGFMLTVNGTSFANNSVVKWNGTNLTTVFVTAKQLTANIPDTALAAPGVVPVTVTNPGTPASGGIYGNGGTMAETSNAVNFTVK